MPVLALDMLGAQRALRPLAGAAQEANMMVAVCTRSHDGWLRYELLVCNGSRRAHQPHKAIKEPLQGWC